MSTRNGKTWTILATVTGIVVVVGGVAWGIIEYHNSDQALAEERIEELRDRHDVDVKEIRQQSQQRLETALDKVVSEERFTAEMRGVQYQITTLQAQQANHKADLDRRLDRIERAVSRRRR